MTENTVNEDETQAAESEPQAQGEETAESAGEGGELIEDGDIAIEVDAGSDDDAVTEADQASASDGDDATAEAAEDVDPAQARIAELEEKVAALEKAKAETYDRLIRTTADFDNYRKRSRREIDDGKVDAKSRALKEILPVIDNLERALAHADGSGGDAAGIIDGVKLVMRQFAQSLARLDVVALEALGKTFDPAVHEAISQMPTDEHPPGTVAAVVQTGYMIGQRLLRPAMVVVAMAAPKPAEPTPGGNGADPDPTGGNGEATDMSGAASTGDAAEADAAAADAPSDAAGDSDDEDGEAR